MRAPAAGPCASHRAPGSRYWAAVLGLLMAVGGIGAAQAEPFELRSATVREVDGVYLLDAVARLRLTPAVRQALYSGVELSVVWRVEIVRERYWWLNADVAEISQRYRIEYHALSRQYLVTNVNTGERRSFVELSVAMNHIGRLFDFPLIDRMLIAGPARYSGRAQVRLDHGALPWPMRPTVLFSSAWDLQSEWRAWSFE